MKKGHRTTSFQNARHKAGQTPKRIDEDHPSPERLAAIFERCGIALTPRQMEQLWLYHGLLRRHNTELNLTRIHNFTNMVLKLYVDSALPGRLTALPSPLMDLGSGPGMPGIPLKILHPDMEIHLAEGRTRRTDFLNETIRALKLEGIRVIDRNIMPGFQQPVEGVITRAVETMDKTLERVQGCLVQDGRMIFMKGPGCGPEIERVMHQFKDRYALLEDIAYRIGQTAHERRLVVFQRMDAPPRALAAKAARRHPVVIIESDQNERFKSLKKLLTGHGLKKGGQALLAGHQPVTEMLTEFPERCKAWITRGDQCPPPEEAPAGLQWLQLSDPLFQALDLFGTHRPLLVIEMQPISRWSPADGFPHGCSLLVPFQDPENVGAVMRSAAAFGVTQVILLAESAHPYHPKALRASGGMAPRLRLRQGPSVKDLPHDLPVLALSADGIDIDRAVFPLAFGLLAGMEGEGLPPSWRKAAIRIPIDPRVDSLNAATATAVALYEWQRRIVKNNEN